MLANDDKLPVAQVVALVKDAVRGDMSSFEELFTSAEKALYRVGLGITGNPEDAEDALAETALVTLESLATLRRPEYFYTWVTRIVINQCYTIGRRQKKIVPLSSSAVEGPDSSAEDYGASQPGTWAWAEYQDLRQALKELTSEHRAVVVLRFIEDLPVADVARILDIPEGTVKSRLHHALKRLQRKLRDSRPHHHPAGGAQSE